MQEESYTSKASFFDGDEIPIYDKENLQEYIYNIYIQWKKNKKRTISNK